MSTQQPYFRYALRIAISTNDDSRFFDTNRKTEEDQPTRMIAFGLLKSRPESSIRKERLKHLERRTLPLHRYGSHLISSDRSEFGTEERKAEFGTEERKAEFGTEERKAEFGTEERKAEFGTEERKADGPPSTNDAAHFSLAQTQR
ncbi:hypothetical protein Tcan_18518 [Toxocara canis]|uniref:Uncharacterized protein n=1 Tax=Toxocara canis TaxID=6265 RepID=A0A0B2W2T7_TOXCA|nr:hypothetical protein Tcan_18518 [Toxocara canis]